MAIERMGIVLAIIELMEENLLTDFLRIPAAFVFLPIITISCSYLAISYYY